MHLKKTIILWMMILLVTSSFASAEERVCVVIHSYDFDSGHEMGYFVASTIFKAENTKVSPSTFPVRKKIPLNLSMNFERAKELKIEVPFEIIAYARSLENTNK